MPENGKAVEIFARKAGEAMRNDYGRLSTNTRGGMPFRTASHTELEPGISKIAVLAKDVDRIRRSPGEPKKALRQPGTLQERNCANPYWRLSVFTTKTGSARAMVTKPGPKPAGNNLECCPRLLDLIFICVQKTVHLHHAL